MASFISELVCYSLLVEKNAITFFVNFISAKNLKFQIINVINKLIQNISSTRRYNCGKINVNNLQSN